MMWSGAEGMGWGWGGLGMVPMLLFWVLVGTLGALFAREDSIEAAWFAIEPILKRHRRALPYKPGSWGPKQADALLAADDAWNNPMPDRTRA